VVFVSSWCFLKGLLCLHLYTLLTGAKHIEYQLKASIAAADASKDPYLIALVGAACYNVGWSDAGDRWERQLSQLTFIRLAVALTKHQKKEGYVEVPPATS
jgi:hypothetical protein